MKNLNIRKKFISLVTAGVLALIPTASQALTGYGDYVKSDSILAMRWSDDLDSEKIGSVPAGQPMRRLYSCDNGWDLVEYDGRLGFIRSSYTYDISDLNSGVNYMDKHVTLQCNRDTNLYLDCVNDDKVICNLDYGRYVQTIAETDNGYYVVEFEGVLGFAKKDCFTNKFFEWDCSRSVINYTNPFINTESILTVRLSPSTESDKIGSLKVGTKLQIVNYNDGWYRIKYNDGFGYVKAQYVKQNGHMTHYTEEPVYQEPVYEPQIQYVTYREDAHDRDFTERTNDTYAWGIEITANNAYVYDNPYAKSRVMGGLVRGDRIRVVAEENGCYMVLYRNNYYWVEKNKAKVVYDFPNTNYNGVYRYAYSTAVLDVRTADSFDKRYITGQEIPKNQLLGVMWENDEFLYVVSNDYIGFVNKKYTKDLNGYFVVVDKSLQMLSVYRDYDKLYETEVITTNDYVGNTIVTQEVDGTIINPGVDLYEGGDPIILRKMLVHGDPLLIQK